MRELVEWILQRFCPEPPEDELVFEISEKPLRVFADAESIIASYRDGQQVELEVLKKACQCCHLHMQDLLVEHNRTLQARRRSAA